MHRRILSECLETVAFSKLPSVRFASCEIPQNRPVSRQKKNNATAGFRFARVRNGVSMNKRSKLGTLNENADGTVARRLWTLPELAAEAGVCRRFLELEATRGRLTVVRMSNRVRVRERDWQAYLSAGEAGRTADAR